MSERELLLGAIAQIFLAVYAVLYLMTIFVTDPFLPWVFFYAGTICELMFAILFIYSEGLGLFTGTFKRPRMGIFASFAGIISAALGWMYATVLIMYVILVQLHIIFLGFAVIFLGAFYLVQRKSFSHSGLWTLTAIVYIVAGVFSFNEIPYALGLGISLVLVSATLTLIAGIFGTICFHVGKPTKKEKRQQ